jgi:hypothetical protein
VPEIRGGVALVQSARCELLHLGALEPLSHTPRGRQDFADIREPETRRLVKGQHGGILRIVANMIDLWRLPLSGPYGSLSRGEVFELKPR